MRRRDFVKAIVGFSAVWPLTARAQQAAKKRVGVLMYGVETDPELVARTAAFRKGMLDAGWNGSNAQFDYRYSADDEGVRVQAKELVALAPDVIMASTPTAVLALIRISRTVPVVFAAVTDPIGLGIVQSLARPGGNATGFLTSEFSFGGKWLELLREVAPGVRRVGVLTDPDNRGAAGQFATIQTAASSLGAEAVLLGFHNQADIERVMAAFARSPDGGLIVLRIAETITHRELIGQLAAKHRLPAVYPLNVFATSGGLVSYGPDVVDQFRQAAGYVDRILKGAKPADLPVQAPTKYELVVNLKAATAIGLTVPSGILSRADQVIE
jgi:putative ABC transport system substrate-binding protein